MKLVRFAYENREHWGILEEAHIQKLTKPPYQNLCLSGERIAAAAATLLAPCKPSKIVCVGLNYHDHAAEMKLALPTEPLLFLKPPTTIIGPHAAIVYPRATRELHYEAELAIVIKERIKAVSAEAALSKILGVTCANDVTARDLQHHDGQWTRAKSFDTFLPLGPWIETEYAAQPLTIQLTVNGQCKQASHTGNLIFSVPQLVSYISQVMTLEAGDVILTGTPAGVGAMQVGDTVEVTIQGIGSLQNSIIHEQ